MENTFGAAFRQWKIPLPNQYSERKRQDIVIFAIIIGVVSVGSRQGLLSWVSTHCGWNTYTVLNVLSKKNASNSWFLAFVFDGFSAMVVQTSCVLLFPDMERRIFHTISGLSYPQSRSNLECLSWDGSTMHSTCAQSAWGNILVYLPQRGGEF